MIHAAQSNFWATLDHLDHLEHLHDTPEEAAAYAKEVAESSRRKLGFIEPPSFRASHIYESTPRPQSLFEPLPGSSRQPTAPMRKRATPGPRQLTMLQTPDVPSPTNTPGPPAPIGDLSRLKSKQDFQTMSKHFATFEKTLSKGKQPLRSTTSIAAPVLQGCRICLPQSVGAPTKYRQRWDIINQLGGTVVIQPDTAITHVIYDGQKATALAKDLGIRSIQELPKDVQIVKWEWVGQCKMNGRRLDETAWQSFKPIRTKSAGPSKLTDISTQIQTGPGVRKRRDATASDSETESSKRPRPYAMKRHSSPTKRHSSPAKMENNRTTHTVSDGPGWKEGGDPLDEAIFGVLSGEVSESDMGAGRGYKCQQANDGANKGAGPNEWLAAKFEEMHEMYAGSMHKNNFQLRGYRLAASAVRNTPWAITSGAAADGIKHLGQSMQDRIDEFISGAPGRQFYDADEQMVITNQFARIYGVGKNLAHDLFQRGARSIEELADPANPYRLSAGQRVGLSLYDDLNTRIPRAECKQISDIIQAEARAFDAKLWIEIMGSYRRGQDSSGDVDFLITRDPSDGRTHIGVLQKLVERLIATGFITHELSCPHDWLDLEAKWMGVCRLKDGLHRRIDILCIPFESWGAALLYFTGNEIFNRSMRLYARKKGFSLNQRGLSVDVIRDKTGQKLTEGTIVAGKTEEEIFETLGLRWRHPHQRRP